MKDIQTIMMYDTPIKSYYLIKCIPCQYSMHSIVRLGGNLSTVNLCGS